MHLQLILSKENKFQKSKKENKFSNDFLNKSDNQISNQKENNFVIKKFTI